MASGAWATSVVVGWSEEEIGENGMLRLACHPSPRVALAGPGGTRWLPLLVTANVIILHLGSTVGYR